MHDDPYLSVIFFTRGFTLSVLTRTGKEAGSDVFPRKYFIVLQFRARS